MDLKNSSVNRRNDIFRIKEICLIPDKFEILLHPIRFSICILLYDFGKHTRTELMNALNLSSGTFSRHIEKLQTNHIIDNNIAFIQSKTHKIFRITPFGIKIYSKLINVASGNLE